MTPLRRLLLVGLLTLAPFGPAQDVTQAPPLLAPPHQQVFINQPPVIDPGVGVALKWQDVANEDGYQIAVNFYPEGSNTPQAHVLYAPADSEVYNLVSLSGGITPALGRYQWRVRGYKGTPPNITQQGPQSEVREFRVVASFQVRQAPDIYPRPTPGVTVGGDGKIDRRDVLAFATQWFKTSSGEPGTDPYNPKADFNGDGAINEPDVLGLVGYLQGAQPAVVLPKVNITYPPSTPTLTVPLSSILSGAFQVEAWWDRVPEAFGYIVHLEFGVPAETRDKFVLNPAGAVSTVTTTLNEFIKVSSLYNVQIAAVDANFVRGEWSDFRRISVPNDTTVTPTNTPNVANRTLDPVQQLFPPPGEAVYAGDHRLVPFIWKPATQQGTPVPQNDVRYQMILGIEAVGFPNNIQVFPLQDRHNVATTYYIGETNSGRFKYVWSVRAQKLSTGEFSPSLVDPDFTPVPTPTVHPYYSYYNLVDTPVVPIPGNVTRYQFHEPNVYRSNQQRISRVNQDFFAFALAWGDTPAPGKVFAQLADLDHSGLVDSRDLLAYIYLTTHGNLLFPDPEFPHPPQLLGPADGVTRPSDNLDLFLEWTAVPGATRYQVVVFYPKETEPQYPTAEAFIYYAAAKQIQPRMPWKVIDATGKMRWNILGEYRWKVRALDDAGRTSAFSETRRFTVVPPP